MRVGAPPLFGTLFGSTSAIGGADYSSATSSASEQSERRSSETMTFRAVGRRRFEIAT